LFFANSSFCAAYAQDIAIISLALRSFMGHED
jgi:hypothetical protein